MSNETNEKNEKDEKKIMIDEDFADLAAQFKISLQKKLAATRAKQYASKINSAMVECCRKRIREA